MSLIVAKIHDEGISIISDSKLTYPDNNELSLENSPLTGTLKTFILYPHLAVSFAGREEPFLEAIRELSGKSPDIELYLEALRNKNIESNNETDFLVSTLAEGNPKLFKISAGTIESGSENFWIGDIDGFNLYQKAFHDDLDLKQHDSRHISSINERMNKAFSSVINSPQIKTVDHFQISIITDKKIADNGSPVFRYQMKTETHRRNFTLKLKADTETQVPVIGTAENGSYTISYITTIDASYHGVALYFHQGKVGIFYCPQLSIGHGVLFKNISGLEFINKIKTDLGIDVCGLVPVDDSGIIFRDTRDCLKQKA